MEVWDAYNRQFERIEGVSLVRGETIPDGVYHLVSDVIVRHIDGEYLLMQRDSRNISAECGKQLRAVLPCREKMPSAVPSGNCVRRQA